MKSTFSAITFVLIVFLSLALLFSALFGLRWVGLEWRGVFGAKSAEIERNIFEESPSFVQARIYDLTRYRRQWMDAEEEPDKRAIEGLIRIQMVNLNPESIRDAELRRFYESVR